MVELPEAGLCLLSYRVGSLLPAEQTASWGKAHAQNDVDSVLDLAAISQRCDTGRQPNQVNREPGNPFGGDLGGNCRRFERPRPCLTRLSRCGTGIFGSR